MIASGRPWLAAIALLVACGMASGEEEGSGSHVAWLHGVRDARALARELGRPLLIAVHRRPVAASPAAARHVADWIRTYRDPQVVEASRAFVCVMRLVTATGDGRAQGGQAPGVTHLVLDAADRVVLSADAPSGTGAPPAVAFQRFLRRALQGFGPIAPGTPIIDPARAAAVGRAASSAGASVTRPVTLPLVAAGLRTRLRWNLPAPVLGEGSKRVRARVMFRWDGEGPFALGEIEFGSGDELDFPLDLRFGDHEALAPLLTEGIHRLDVYLEPLPDSYPFSRGPLHAGRVFVSLGQGGGGAGADDDPESEPEPPEPEQPAPTPPEGADEGAPPPPPQRTEVVDPFVREGDTVRKEDAVVAVPDPDAAVKPPRRVPLEDALREFEKLEERAVGEERVAPRDRDLLTRYFEALRDAVRKGPR